MNTSPRRVAFAGLAHSHPYSDAANVRALGGEISAVWDADAAAADAFAERFGGVAVRSLDALPTLKPDLVIATPRTPDAAVLVRALVRTFAEAFAGETPIFVNKVVAATADQLAEWDRAVGAAPVGTSSVLRFAPALAAFRDSITRSEIVSIRVRAQHDSAGFQLPGRDWQDDPGQGGGTLVTVGVHAWEMVDVVVPGARLIEGSGESIRAPGSTTGSEDAAHLDGLVEIDGRVIPVHATVTGAPGPDAYAIEVVTADGIRSVDLDVDVANEALGFRPLIRELLAESTEGRIVAPWAQARTVVENTIRAAGIARAVMNSGERGD